MSDPNPGGSRPWQRWEVVGVAGFALGHLVLGLGLLPGWMFAKYPDAARLLRAGQLRPDSAADFSPLYLLLNAVVGPTPLRWLQSGVGGACVLAVHAIARAPFGRHAGLAAAAVLALSAPVLAYEATLEPDIWVMALGTLGLLLLLSGSEAPRVAADLGAGVALGLSVAARPSSLSFVVLAVGWAFARQRRNGAARPWLAPALFGAAALVSAISPALALRAWAGQAPATTMSPGAVLHHGNRPEGTGLGAQPPVLIKLLELQLRSPSEPDPVHALYRRFARASAGVELTPGETERFWMKKVAAFALDEPVGFVAQLYRKLCFFIFGPDGHDVGQTRVAAARLERLPLIRAEWLGLLGSVSLVLLAAARKRVGLLALYLGTTTLMALTFYVVSRYRLAAVPVWSLLIGGLAALISEALRARRRLAVGALVAGAGLAWVGVSSGVRDARSVLDRGGVAADLAVMLERQRAAGELGAARDTFIKLQGAQPFVVLTRDLRGIPFEAKADARASARYAAATFGETEPADSFFLALLAVRAGDCAAAALPLERAIAGGFRSAIFDLSLDPYLLAAQCALDASDKPAAMKWVSRSLQARPGTLNALALAVAGGDAASERELLALHDLLSARFALARARLAFGDAPGALADADAVLEALPEAGVVHYERALALARLGRLPGAAEAYFRALELFPTHAFPAAPLDAAVRARLEQSPDDPLVLASAAEHHLRAGELSAARALADRASALWGTNAPAAHRARQRFLAAAR